VSQSVSVCEGCGAILGPDDEVIAAARQLDVTSQTSAGREYIDGIRSLFHVHHYPGNGPMWRERARGHLSDLTQR
jgi:hypothetical protein